MKNQNKKHSQQITPRNATFQELPQTIIDALKNKQALFGFGFVDYDNIYIEKMRSNKPSDLKSVNIPQGVTSLYIMELDRELVRIRADFYSYKDFIYCDFTPNGKAIKKDIVVPYKKRAKSHNKYVSYSFAGIDNFYREGDYEKARKCAKNIWYIWQPNHTQEIVQKQEQRKEARQWAITRALKVDTRLTETNYKSGLYYVSEIWTKNDLSQVEMVYDKWNWYNDRYNTLYFQNKESAQAHYIDKSGYCRADRKAYYKAKLEEWKKAQDKSAFKNANHSYILEFYLQKMNDLCESLNALTNKFTSAMQKGEKMRVFWFSQRVDRTSDAISTLSEFYNSFGSLERESILQKEYLSVANCVQKALLLNEIWLNISSEERANEDNEKDRAIYYGYVNYAVNEKGIITGACLDLEKAR